MFIFIIGQGIVYLEHSFGEQELIIKVGEKLVYCYLLVTMSEGKPPFVTTITDTHLTSDECLDSSEVGVNIGGLAAVIVFYLAVLLVSI